MFKGLVENDHGDNKNSCPLKFQPRGG